MPIDGLMLHSSYNRNEWLLEPVDEKLTILDNIKGNVSEYYNQINYNVYQWHIRPLHKGDLDLQNLLGYGTALFTGDENDHTTMTCDRIAAVVQYFILQWRCSFLRNTNTLMLSGILNNLLRYIRDSFYIHISNGVGSRNNLRGICGYWINVKSSLPELYAACIEFISSRFCIKDPAKFSNRMRHIHVIELCQYLYDPKGLLLWYNNSACAKCCCCKQCNEVYKYLQDSDKYKIVDMIKNTPRIILKFIKDNKSSVILEHKLLSIILEAYLLKIRLFNTISGTNAEYMLENAAVYVIIKDFNTFCRISILGSTEASGLNLSNMALDLINEYTDLWAQLDLLIFMFAITKYDIQGASTVDNELIITQSCSIPFMTLSGCIASIPYFECTLQIPDELYSEHTYKEHLIKQCIKINDENIRREVIRRLLSLTEGYNYNGLISLMAMARNNAVKHTKNIHHSINFTDENCLEYFEKATYLKKPSSLMISMSDLCRIMPYTAVNSYCSSNHFLPLDIDELGIYKGYLSGFKALVIPNDLMDWLCDFFNEDISKDDVSISLLIQGPSGCGKSSLAMAMAVELKCSLVICNVIEYMRPQVGLAEKLLHDFFTALDLQFNGGCCSGETRSLGTKCILLLEGLDTLHERGAGYERRIILSLTNEIDALLSRSYWQGIRSILLICTAVRSNDIPSRLIVKSRFGRILTLPGTCKEPIHIRQCLELYLNGRVETDSIDLDVIVDVLIDHLKGAMPTYGQIAVLCKEAGLSCIAQCRLENCRRKITNADLLNKIRST